MKILRITLNNIASLAGTHTVDFTRDPLRSAGLFSISGATGAGKSTLLDALCLALYDATPRLNQVGRLAELANGEKQNDPRNLLRRGAGEGFAEVAFLGVDGQAYTSRWNVRRSRRSADGALQNVEMTLYKGHLAPGGEGPVDEGGKKTLVLKAIQDRIGLTFEQFTRAVLLAQNDFATFLKAEDKERAEILQALTGTAQFESISKAVFLRCGVELKTLDNLRAELAGNAPMNEDARLEAEAACSLAEQQLLTTESRQKELQLCADWFLTRAKLTAEKSQADEALQQSISSRAAAEPRRAQLAMTEEISRDARPLRVAEKHAAEKMAISSAAVDQAKLKHDELETRFVAVIDRHRVAADVYSALLAEQQAIVMPLQKARELDATLAIVQAQFQKASTDLDGSQVAVKSAEVKWKSIVDDRNARLQEQQTLQRDRERLKAFAPFVTDSSKWLDRIDAAIVSAQQVHAARQKAKSLIQELAELDERVKSAEETRTPLQTAFESATAALSVAIEANKQFDADQIASERARLESSKSVLTEMFLQLRNAQTLGERIKSEQESLEQIQAAQGFDATAIEQIQMVELPQAERAIDVAKTQLEFIQAAVDDHAKRLRLTLQDGKECPVCGSIHHPYSQHEPDLEATAVKAAKKSVKEFEKKRDEVSNRESRLRGSMETRLQQIETKTQELALLRAEVVDIVFESHEHPEVLAVLAIEEDARLAVMESRLLEINRDLRSVESKEQKARTAAKYEVDCRSIVERSAAELKELSDRVTELLAQRGILNETVSNAQHAVQTADKLRAESESRLNDLWSGLPAARQEYDSNAVAFRQAFERSATECGDIEKRLAEATNLIQQADAALRPLEESLAEARKLAAAYEAAFQDISKDRASRLKEREQIFDGRPADDVEKELKERIMAAAESLDAATHSRTEVDRLLVAAKSEFETKSQAAEVSQAELAAARSARESWLTTFIARTEKDLTLADLDEVLARDKSWIQSERESLKQLDEHVKAAEGACQVHANQLQQHLQTQPTQDEEQVVLASLQALNEDVAQAKARLSGAQAVILNDNNRREQNLQLTGKIRQQDAKADPWRKLNDLIGSADGAKFRMIAQRRTLDLLLRYANHQLNHLAVRYRLERLPESLNLIVIDRDMGDERRSIHSLSGGESFLVSLALALGLASLTSNRLRIESLFIDEGFGSLDPETLNTAMSALMHLESQGRKVGVISHVTEMTDAIPVQIKVVKGRGGASRIVVPGALPEPDISMAAIEEVTTTTAAASTENPEDIARRMLAILKREHDRGRAKISSKALREELGCDAKQFRLSQTLLGAQVLIEGRSLRFLAPMPE